MPVVNSKILGAIWFEQLADITSLKPPGCCLLVDTALETLGHLRGGGLRSPISAELGKLETPAAIPKWAGWVSLRFIYFTKPCYCCKVYRHSEFTS